MQIPNVNMPFFLKIESGVRKRIIPLLFEYFSPDTNVLLLSDEIVYKKYGNLIYEQIKAHFNLKGIKIIKTNNLQECFKLIKILLGKNIDLVIGLGGGRVLDMGKQATFMSKKKFISIPTAIAHDGIASPIAVLKTNKGVKSLGSHIPSGIIIDLDIIIDSPKELTKAGIGDTLSNYTAILDWKYAASRQKIKTNDFAILLSITAFNALFNYENPDLNDVNFLRQLAESVILSGLAMNMAGNSRPCSGSEHLISHSMDTFGKNNLHGIQVATASIISAYLHGKNYLRLKRFLDKFGIPYHLSQLGFSKEDFFQIMQNAIGTRPNRYTILNDTDLSDDNLNIIYNKLYNENGRNNFSSRSRI